MSQIRILTDQSIERLKKLLDVNAARQKVAAKNLANCDTEGYVPEKVEFSQELGKALGKVDLVRTSPKHISSIRQAGQSEEVRIVRDESQSDDESALERTIAELADAELAYSVAARLMAKRGATLRTAITGRP